MPQDAISRLCRIAPKLTDGLEPEQIDAATSLLDQIVHPLSPDDIEALMALLPAQGDTAYGLNWTILHGIEASPHWPLWDMLRDTESEWVDTFLRRLANGGIHPPQ